MVSICFFNSTADDESSDEFFAAILFIFVCSTLYKLNRLYLIHLRKFVFVFNFQRNKGNLGSKAPLAPRSVAPKVLSLWILPLWIAFGCGSPSFIYKDIFKKNTHEYRETYITPQTWKCEKFTICVRHYSRNQCGHKYHDRCASEFFRK